MLNIEELYSLEDRILEELREHLTETLSRLNRSGELQTFLKLLKLEHLLESESDYEVFKNGKIIVIGQSDPKKDVLLGVAKSLGLDKDRFEFYLEYNDGKTFNFKKTQWQPSYSLIMTGPMPHSGISMGEYSSMISALESTEGYPPVMRLGTSGLNISKSDFKIKLKRALELGYII